MNTKNTEYLEVLIKSMDTTEKEDFKLRSPKSNAKYVQLFQMYCQQITDNGFASPNKLKEQFGLNDDAFNKLQKDLLNSILLFIGEKEKKDSVESRIEDHLLKVRGLLKRDGVQNIVWDEFKKTMDLLSSVVPGPTNYHLFIQVLDIYRFTNISYRPGKGNQKGPEFEEDPAINWLAFLARSAANNFALPKEGTDLSPFLENPLIYSMMDVLHKRKEYDIILDIVNQNPKRRLSQALRIEKPLATNALASFNLLLQYFAAFSAFKLGDEIKFQTQMSQIEELISNRKNDLGYATYAFVYLNLLELQLLFGFRNPESKTAAYLTTKWEKPKIKLDLMLEKEFANIPIRLEINQALIQFHNRNFKDARKLFEALLDKSIKYPIEQSYCKILCQICILEIEIISENFENVKRSIINQKDRLPDFILSFLPMLSRYQSQTERKGLILQEEFQTLEQKVIGVMDHAILDWIRFKQPELALPKMK